MANRPGRDQERPAFNPPPPRYPLPRETARAIGLTKDNAGLVFKRLLPTDYDLPERTREEKNYKQKHSQRCIKDVVNRSKNGDRSLLCAWNGRWEAIGAACHAVPFDMLSDWRFLSGLGAESALEVGFSFHRYGFPFLPGSSVKGLARAWALYELSDVIKGVRSLKKLDDVLSSGSQDEDFRKEFRNTFPDIVINEEVHSAVDDFRMIFGTQAVRGKAVFLNAIPHGRKLPGLEMDIMTPHFQAYYMKDKYPKDNDKPNPVPFLTVAADTAFRFAVGWSGSPDEEGSRLRDHASACLKQALQKLGAGAKTGAGYGYFREAGERNQSEPQETSDFANQFMDLLGKR